MLQIISITEARNNLAKLIQKVKETKKPVVIVQDSNPSVVLYPYEEAVKDAEKREQLFEVEFQAMLAEGKKLFTTYVSKKKIKQPLTEEDVYYLIKHD